MRKRKKTTAYSLILGIFILLSGCGGSGNSSTGAGGAAEPVSAETSASDQMENPAPDFPQEEISDEVAIAIVSLAIIDQTALTGSSPYPLTYRPTQAEIECVKRIPQVPGGFGWQPVIACLDNN